MLNQTDSFHNTVPVTSEMMPSASTALDSELDVGVTVLANESCVENVTTDGMIWSLDCTTFVMEYGIIACVICVVAFIIGVVFCLFGEY